MDHWQKFPDMSISAKGEISNIFITSGVNRFHGACEYVQLLPYGYNSDRDDSMTLFKENKGSCTTKHAVIALLAHELGLPVNKQIGIYAMTEDIVEGAGDILKQFGLPYVPMVHCFLVSGNTRVDLTEGNRNGKRCAIDTFLFYEDVRPDITSKEEYLLYKNALLNEILKREEMMGIEFKRLLKAREMALTLLKRNILQVS